MALKQLRDKTNNNNEDEDDVLLNDWTSHHVSEWLQSIGMEEYISNFIDNKIFGSNLCKFREIHEFSSKLGIDETSKHGQKLWKRLKYLQGRWKSEVERRKRRDDERNGIPSQRKRKGRKGKHASEDVSEKKEMNGDDDNKVDISSPFFLYNNGAPYVFGKICTFCLEEAATATWYCPDCREFLCEKCNVNTHQHLKRKHHIRSRISKKDGCESCIIVTNFFRYIQCRRKLRQLVRETFERRYDPKSRQHYYRNLKTLEVQWYKPLSLGSEELKPFLTSDEASFKILRLYVCWKAQMLLMKKLREQYVKFYSLKAGRFYYQYIGRQLDSENEGGVEQEEKRIFSKLVLDRTRTRKPTLLHSTDLQPKFTTDLAIMRIQKFTRHCFAIKTSRNMIRRHWERILDPITGRHFYHNPRTSTKCWHKPLLLGKERWDPTNTKLWSVIDVNIYLRRNGLKKLKTANDILSYEIDGPLLLSLEEIDFDLMGLSEDLAEKIKNLSNKFKTKHRGEVLYKRDRLRVHLKMLAAVRVLQRSFRNYLRNSELDFYNVVKRKCRLKHRIDKRWWSDYGLQVIELPRKGMVGKRRRSLMVKQICLEASQE